jgi:hypothetical protein
MAETVNYGLLAGFSYFKNSVLSSAKTVSELVDVAIGVASELNCTDEIILNSSMSIFNIMYDLRGSDEIRGFLKSNSFLIPLVSEAYDKLQMYFPYSTIFAEVIQNELVISVGTTLSPKEAKEQLYKFDED